MRILRINHENRFGHSLLSERRERLDEQRRCQTASSPSRKHTNMFDPSRLPFSARVLLLERAEHHPRNQVPLPGDLAEFQEIANQDV